MWGRGDNLGTLNRLTGPVVAAAASGVRTGERIGVSLPLGLPDPPFFGRKGFRHSFESMGPGVWDDWLDGLYLQCSTQWDGLRHIGSPDGWYGGWRDQPSADLEPLGIHHWAQQGIVGRGVLADVASFAAPGSPGAQYGLALPGGYDPFTRVAIRPEDLAGALRAQGTELRPGDILCVRTGWVDQYLALDPAERSALRRRHAERLRVRLRRAGRQRGDGAVPVGLRGRGRRGRQPGGRGDAGRPVRRASCTGGSSPASAWRSASCSRSARSPRRAPAEQRHEFLFVSVPLNVTGAIGSPGNAVAVL